VELHNFFPSPNTIKAIMYKTKWWSGDPVTNIMRRETRTDLAGKREGNNPYWRSGLDGMKILKHILKKKDRLSWIHLTQDRYKWSFSRTW